MTAEETARSFASAFATAFGAQDAGDITGHLAPEASIVTLTGLWAEGRVAARAAFQVEFAGALRRARLVTGRLVVQPMGPGAMVLHQRFVVTGVVDEGGADLPRLSALLSAVLVARPDGWQALSLTLSALSE